MILQQLYEIAVDQDAPLEQRYEAARKMRKFSFYEEGERQMKRCKYPGCGRHSTRTWALVPLCDEHHEAIRIETVRYYRPSLRMTYEERHHYLKIAPLIPWSRKE